MVRKIIKTNSFDDILSESSPRKAQFSPVVTLDHRGVALTGPLGRTAQVADRVIQYK